jgi:predicted nucleotidyltransferase
VGLLKLRNQNSNVNAPDPRRLAHELVSKLGLEIPILKGYLFGSGVRNNMTPDSDLDLLVILENLEDMKKAYKVVGQKKFSPIAVDWIFKNSVDFEKRKDFGGVCFEAHHHGVVIYEK